MMFLLYSVLLLTVLVPAYIRLAPSDAARWHQDPETAASTGKPNEFRTITPTFDIAPDALAGLVDEFILKQARVTSVAGTVDGGMITYVQRSKLMGYPDYITVKVIPVASGQAKLAILSRSRFGHSDLGINKGRVDRWVDAVTVLVAGR